MDCLVTGGAGFIGSHLVDALLARGDTVTVLDDLSNGKRDNLASALDRGAFLRVGDVRNASEVTAAFEAARPALVVHLAAAIDVRFSVAQPVEDASVNLLGTINVLEAARRSGARRLVYSSTGGAIYGETDVIPTSEAQPVRPLAPYGQSKFAAEGYCELYSRVHGLSTISLRYSNVYGPRQDAYGEGGVVAIFAACLAEGRRPTVFGDGLQSRDWVEVSDVVRANLVAAVSPLTGPVNIACGEETSVLDLIAALNEISEQGSLLPPDFAPERLGEVRRSCLDPARAGAELGWEAEVDLRAGLRRLMSSM
jgi:UDP-glucose 4-epimerase